jgi:hypothetical protein
MLEAVTIWLIHKAMKFTLHKKLIGSIIFSFFALGVSWLNFYSSTTGLKQKSFDIVSKKDAIQEQFSVDSLNLQARIIPKIDSLIFANSKLSSKTTLQNTTIIAGNSEMIKSLREELKTEKNALNIRFEAAISNDKQHAKSKSNAYWKVVIVNQIILYVSYIFTAFYYYRTDEENKNLETRVNDFSSEMVNRTMNAIHEMANAQMLTYFGHVLHNTEQQMQQTEFQNQEIEVPIAKAEVQEEKKEVQEQKADTNSIIGFGKQTRPATEANEASQPSSHLKATTSHNVQNQTEQAKKIRRLTKHQELVRIILETVDTNQESISNSEINHIISSAKAAKNKSRTLIQNLFQIINLLGKDKVEEVIK